MNLIRLIKLKQLNDELVNLTDNEKKFLSFFDNLISTTTNHYHYYINNNGEIIFKYDKRYNMFVISRDIYLNFKDSYYIVSNFIKYIKGINNI